MNNPLLIVADSALIKAYSVERTPQDNLRLELIREISLSDAHHHLVDIVTDKAGRHGSPTQKNWGAPVGDDEGIKRETRRRLVRQIAAHIEDLIEKSNANICWLSASIEINRSILDAMSPDTVVRIRKNLLRDLTSATRDELIQQFLNSVGSSPSSQ